MWLAVNGKNEEERQEVVFFQKPSRINEFFRDFLWVGDANEWNGYKLQNGTIERLVEKRITWDDEPIEFNNCSIDFMLEALKGVLEYTDACRCYLFPYEQMLQDIILSSCSDERIKEEVSKRMRKEEMVFKEEQAKKWSC